MSPSKVLWNSFFRSVSFLSIFGELDFRKFSIIFLFWGRFFIVIFLLLQPKKPKLSRKIVQSAKVNLNLYWNEFQVDHLASEMDYLSMKIDSVHHQNAINENLSNELMEKQLIM